MVDKYEVPVKHQLTIENREKMDMPSPQRGQL